MSQDPSHSTQSSEHVTELLARFLNDDSCGRRPDFEALCAKHPEHADSLRRRLDDWKRFEPLFSKLQRGDSFHEQLSQSLGPEPIPDVSLDSEGSPAPPKPSAESTGATDRLYGELISRRSSSRRYTIRGEINRGAMGVIFRAWDDDLRRSLAMKVLREDVARVTREPTREDLKRDLLRRFLEEAQVTAQLEHPGVVPVHDIGIDEKGRIFFTMKLVKGRNLKEIFELVHAGKEGWTLTRALGVILKVCEALAFAHDKGVIHRDLKPANVMVGRFGETYVMDWGLARILGSPVSDAPLDRASERSEIRSSRREDADAGSDSSPITEKGQALGTPAYMPPEQALGLHDDVSVRSDIYSVGAILYHLLAGHPPYVTPGVAMTADALMRKVANGSPPALRSIAPDTPEELESICGKAMQRNADDRYATALDIARDVEAYLGKRPVGAHQPSLPHVLRLAVRRNLPVAITAACSAVLLGAVLLVFITGLQSARRESERLADLTGSRVLLDEERALTPRVPGAAASTERWLARADGPLARLPAYRAELGSGLAPSPPFTADDLAQVTARLDQLSARVTRVRADLADARGLAKRTVTDAQSAWDAVFSDLAGDPRFAGLRRIAQIGLIPLEKNATTQLWEFWHVQSGDRPERVGGDAGRYDMSPGAGMILVLLPGGTFQMGSNEEDIRAGRAQPFENPHAASLVPYFLSKYEVTQGQWLRAMETNPARESGGTQDSGVQFTLAHPVESVSFVETQRFAQLLDLQLPTEAQFEFACRAGDLESLQLSFGGKDPNDENAWLIRENVADQSHRSERNQDVAPWDDGYHFHAPVGSFQPNAFGLFDTLGNVSEWCLDRWQRTHVIASDRPGDGLSSETKTPYRAIRGGSWGLELKMNRPAFRVTEHESRYVSDWLGARLARAWRSE